MADKKRSVLAPQEYVKGVLSGDRTVLARTITLIESNAAEHIKKARTVLKHLLPFAGKSFRIGITGMPGAGKSTLIEALGCFLVEKGFKVAVLAVDPTSSITRGSILGDKTRMEKLSRRKNAFIRPSPSGGTLGGVTRKSLETIIICESAGFDIIIIETVGVGQNEITVRSMVDFFLLVLIPGAGDELQGIKRGVIEIADALIINKADGYNREKAERVREEYSLALKYLAPATPGWKTRAYLCSALNGEGVAGLWETIGRFRQKTRESGIFYKRRQNQNLDWMFGLIENRLRDDFFSHPGIQRELSLVKEKVLDGSILPTAAAERLLNLFFDSRK